MDPNQQPQTPPPAPQPQQSQFNPVQQPQINNPMVVMQPGEQVLAEIKRSPIGLIGTYISAVIAVIAAALIVVLVPHFVTDLSSQIKSALLILLLLVLVIVGLFVYITATVYKSNRWILTSDSLTQVTQAGLFRKQTSQLSLANLEDVTAQQNGLFQSMFGFGTLRVETAGERSKFVFPYCPNPNAAAQQILSAREAFIRNDSSEAREANDQLNVPRYQSNDPANGHGV